MQTRSGASRAAKRSLENEEDNGRSNRSRHGAPEYAEEEQPLMVPSTSREPSPVPYNADCDQEWIEDWQTKIASFLPKPPDGFAAEDENIVGSPNIDRGTTG